MSIEFEAQVQQLGERLIVRLPSDASAALPSRGQVAVEGELNGHRLATVLEPDGRKGHWIAVDAALREAVSLMDGARVTGVITPTEVWPEPDLPDDLRSALEEASDLGETWASLTPMARWEWARWIKATKNSETRQRRVEVSISKLREGKRRPCCFDLSSCTDPEVAKSGKLVEVN